MCCRWDWNRVLARLQHWLSSCSLKRVFKYISYDVHVFLWILKISCRLENFAKKLRKNVRFWDKCIWTGCIKLSRLRTQYLSSAVVVLRNSIKILYVTKTDFFQLQLPSKWSMNMVKVLMLRLNQWFVRFTILPVQGSSEMEIYRHLSNHVFSGP